MYVYHMIAIMASCQILKFVCFYSMILAVYCYDDEKNAHAAPKFSGQYTIQGTIQLPYAEIEEPFTVYYDNVNNRSRIDYYGGMVVIIQRGDIGSFGRSYQVFTLTTEKIYDDNVCWYYNGTVDFQITIQGVLPDITNFTYIGQETIGDIICDKYENSNDVGTKENTYTMWVNTADQSPVQYEMMGYDTLMGSHYDKYIIQYYNYVPKQPNISDFDIPHNLTCTKFGGSSSMTTSALSIHLNPFQEYFDHSSPHVDNMFHDFKQTHSMEYSSTVEHEQRKHIFKHNLRYIHSTNRQGLSYKLHVNHLADRSEAELRLMNGYHYQYPEGAQMVDGSKYTLKDIPDYIDWRLYGAVTPVKDQAICGSCWSFGTVGTIEGAYFLSTGNLIRMSQQELMDCSWGQGNMGCDGGNDITSYQWIVQNDGGLTSEDQYGEYLAVDGICHSRNVSGIVQLAGYAQVKPYAEDVLRMAIAIEGPISVAIDASHKSFSFYANGVYYEPKCGSKPDDLDHAVLAVGYGTLNNQSYWLIKNSWSTYWGMDGYILMSQKDNNCGVATAATYVLL